MNETEREKEKERERKREREIAGSFEEERTEEGKTK